MNIDLCFCQEPATEGDIVTMKCCSKNIHLNCLKPWMKSAATCPYCREEVGDQVILNGMEVES